MNFLIVLVLTLGYVGVVLSQTTCSDTNTYSHLKSCADAFNVGKSDTSGNEQIKCDAARSFSSCTQGYEHCLETTGYGTLKSEADQISYNYPCSTVQTASGNTNLSYLPMLLLFAAFICLV